jgi:hypothetical protein
LFDLDAVVRAQAANALYNRKFDDFLSIILDGLRHPLPIVAEHAAETLIRLDIKTIAPRLVDLLELPDPRAPFTQKGMGRQPMVRELVRVNHLRNCLLCHAPLDPKTATIAAVVAGAVPQPGRPLPSNARVYYSQGDAFVRADVTYLKQDFSVMHVVGDAEPWPSEQRYDYFVRTRPATPKEQTRVFERYDPQKECVLAVLRHITGIDVGDDRSAWKAVLRSMAL